MKKKVLIIAYYWPPAGGPGVQRWLKFAKYLPEFGIEPIIYTPENPSYPVTDESLVDEIPANIAVIRHPIIEPHKWAELFSKKQTQTISSGIISESHNQSILQKWMLYIRGNFFIPDARFLWVKPSIKKLQKIIREQNIKTVITTGPPHSMHLIGLGLKKQTHIQWMADFRDPWTSMWYFNQLKLNKRSLKKHKNLEKKVLKSADEIIVTTRGVQKEFQSKTDQNVTVITNGFDNDSAISSTELDADFTLSHIGSFFSIENLKFLWEAIRELTEENEAFKRSFKLRLIGKNNPELRNELNRFNLLDYTEDLGYLPHSEVLQYQQQSQVLLLQYTNEETKGIIPGKLFEYIQSARPVLAIGPKGWEAGEILKETQTGMYYYFSEKERIKQGIFQYFEAYQQGKLRVNAQNILPFHRRNLTEKLSKLIQ